MRPIRRFGTPTLISDRFGSKSYDKINTLTRPTWTLLDDDRRKLRSLFYANNYAHSISTTDKENRSEDVNGVTKKDEPEIIMNTPSFQLVCDRRRVHHRNASADDAIGNIIQSNDDKPAKSAMKKSQTDGSFSSSHRSRWTTFKRSVSFADDKGYRLTEIRLIEMNIPEDLPSNQSFSFGGRQASGFMADFILPPAYRRLRALQTTDTSPPISSSQIVLESYSSSRWDVKGVIAVRKTTETTGLKRVFVRYTNDHWTTSTDNDATISTDKSDPGIEKYSFTLPFPLRPATGSKLEFKFGVRMPAGVGGVLSPITYWDDNHGSNYSFTFV
jgi:hypothetical protein